jgi:hypothetical protein
MLQSWRPDHLGREIDAEHSALRSDLVSSQDDVDTAPAPQVHHRFPGLKVGETGRVPAPTGEVEGKLGQQRKLGLGIETLIDREARTGLCLTRSTGLLVAPGLSERPVTALYHPVDMLRAHRLP